MPREIQLRVGSLPASLAPQVVLEDIGLSEYVTFVWIPGGSGTPIPRTIPFTVGT